MEAVKTEFDHVFLKYCDTNFSVRSDAVRRNR